MSRENGKERRSSDRVVDDSILLVSGYNASGLPFSETTKVNDVSRGGISFLLRTHIEIDSVLDVRICLAQGRETQSSPNFHVKVQVLRVTKGKGEDGHRLVAAQFQGEFLKLSGSYEIDEIARELQEAVEFDERTRDEY